MADKFKSTIKIKVSGMTESDLVDAFNVAVRKVREGYTSGFDSNGSGGYKFDVSGDSFSEDVPEEDEN